MTHEYAVTNGTRFATFGTDELVQLIARWPALDGFYNGVGMCSQDLDEGAIGFDPLPPPSVYKHNNHLGEYQYTLAQAMKYVLQDDPAPPLEKYMFSASVREALVTVLRERGGSMPQPGSPPAAWITIDVGRPSRAAPRAPKREGIKKIRRARPAFDPDL